MYQPSKFLIDGIDRLGKSTLINGILQRLGYHLVIHFDKPKSLEFHINEACVESALNEEAFDKNLPLKYYQEYCNATMFNLMRSDARIIFDRTHLGEMVYAPLYRKYSGEYVYDLEKIFVEEKKFTEHGEVRMILLTTSNFDIVKDDGLSFDFSKKEDEQKLFQDAFYKSNLTNKIIIDVHNGAGGYRSAASILDEALFTKAKI